MSLLMESVVISFALGGVVGAVIAIHLLYRKKSAPAFSEQSNNSLDDEDILRQGIEARIKIPPRR